MKSILFATEEEGKEWIEALCNHANFIFSRNGVIKRIFRFDYRTLPNCHLVIFKNEMPWLVEIQEGTDILKVFTNFMVNLSMIGFVNAETSAEFRAKVNLETEQEKIKQRNDEMHQMD